jgi:hypothetical protein
LKPILRVAAENFAASLLLMRKLLLSVGRRLNVVLQAAGISESLVFVGPANTTLIGADSQRTGAPCQWEIEPRKSGSRS